MNNFEEIYKQFPTPILQVLILKQGNPTPQGIARWRVTLSDGQQVLSALLATQTHHLIQEEKLVRHCIVRLDQFTKQNANGKQ